MNLLFRPEGVRRGPRCEEIRLPWVLVLDGTVVHCAPQPPDGIPEGLESLAGGWLLEPLVDAHVHLFLPGSLDPAEQKRTAQLPRDQAVERVLLLLRSYRSAGVAAVRDAGDPRGLALEVAAEANRRPDVYAAVLPAGEPIFPRGGYGGFLGSGIDGVDAGLRRMEENRAAGATHAKILATGVNSLEEAGRVGAPQFTREEFRFLFSAAGERGIPLMVHANGPVGSWGCNLGRSGTLEHGFWLDERDLSVLSQEQTAWVPTLGAWEELAGRRDLPEPARAVIAETARRHRQEVARGAEAGVPVLCGTDAGSPGVPHAGALQAELCRLAEVLGGEGEALAAACHRGAALCQGELGRRLGGLEVGHPAAFLWTEEDPGQDLGTLARPKGVFLGGEWSPTGTQGNE